MSSLVHFSWMAQHDALSTGLGVPGVQIESQKEVTQQAAAEAQARSRVEKVKNDLVERTRGLERAAAAAEVSGSLIEANAAQVDACIMAINSQLATGIAWNELERLLEEERSRGAPVAQVRI